jgi:hypothetical protein
MEILMRCQATLPDIEKLDLQRLLPNLETLCSELEMRFELIQGMLAGEAPARVPQSLSLVADKFELAALSPFEKAALAVTRVQLERFEALSRRLFDCVEDIKDFRRQPLRVPRQEPPRTGLALDPDRFATSIRVIATLWIAFLLWVYIDPPGHSGFVVLAVSFGVAFGKFPQLRVSKAFLPVALSCFFAVGLYLFVMPHLSGYVQLGTMIFAATFGIAYLYSEPRQVLVRKLALIFFAVITSIDNQQTYNFSEAANTTLEALLIISLLVVTSYIPYNRQPEKMFLRLLSRFFRQAGFLVSPPTIDLGQATWTAGWWQRLRSRNDLLALPEQLGMWGTMVDQRKFVGDSPDQMQTHATRLHMLGHRLQALLEARHNPQSQFLVQELSEDVLAWRLKMQELFQLLAKNPAAIKHASLRARLDRNMEEIEARIKNVLNKADKGQINDRDSENFYHILGAYRGVSEAAIAYVEVSGAIDWAPWHEERF